uniref:FCH domain only protein 2 n=1 Tax=Lygus hesperus TaxID=30085 RepID=A0A0A9YQI7_LYGHE
MTVDFRDYFWGEKNNGFDVLYHNMKYGLVASKELAEFLRERSNIEENNWKLVSKLAKQASSSCTQGTFGPLWVLLRTTAEKLATLHLQMVQKVSDLVKEVTKYADELHRKHKTVKEEEGSTLEVVQAIQSTSITLQKARDAFTQKGIELDKLKKESASAREVEKAEQKLKKAQDEYKVLIEKYGTIKEEFEKKMSLACKRFQEVEELHLKQMKDFLTTYAELAECNHDSVGQVHIEFKRQCLEMTVEKLLEQFVLNKYTGLEKPVEFTGVMEVESVADVVSASDAGKVTNTGTTPSNNQSSIKREGFLRSRRDKRKEKKGKKKKDAPQDNTSNKEEKSDTEEKEEPAKSKTPTPEVDDEGYCVRPKVETWDIDKGSSFYSSSDSDSDDEREKKIRVEIKPLSNGSGPMSASVDELRATVENLSLSPIGNMPPRRAAAAANTHMKRSQSVSQQIGGKAIGDMTRALNTTQSPTGSSASTPTGNHPYAPLQSPTPPITSANNKYADLGDIFAEVGDMKSNPLQKRQSSTPTSISSTIIPRPPSRKSEGGVRSPVPSQDGIEFRASGILLGSSRGPSPLTIGMADTIPLAIAFHEMIHSFFKGTDENKCQVKLCGDMMISFPAGIVTILTNNPSPAQLSFRLQHASNLECVLPNKQLLNVSSEPSSASSWEDSVYEFDMSALTKLLRRQSEENPSASYFNVDILKYQIKPKTGAESCPLQLVTYWKCEKNHTDLRIDYKYNSHAMHLPSPLLNLNIVVPVEGTVTNIHTRPTATWVPDTHRALWKFTELSHHSERNGVGSLRARFEVADGPGDPTTIAAQFNCEGTTLSGIDFVLVGSGYRISLVKRRFISGKYVCDGRHAEAKTRYSTPSNPDC